MELGTTGKRHSIYLLFPHLYTGHAAPFSQAQLQSIYENGVLPSVTEICPSRLGYWPNSYALASTLQASSRGFSNHSIDIPNNLLDDFAAILLKNLSKADPQFAGAYFVHIIKGEKNSTTHEPKDHCGVLQALTQFTATIDTDSTKFDIDNWVCGFVISKS